MYNVPPTGKKYRVAAGLIAVLLLGRCDVPTEPPRVDLTTGFNAPLLVEKTFVLLGPSDTGFDALIDTTSSDFGSMLSVDPSDQTIALYQETDGFHTDLSERFLPSVDVAPIDVSFSADEIAAAENGGGSQDETWFKPNGESFGTTDAAALGVEGVRFDGDADYARLSAGWLRIESLVNEFDMAFEDLLISVPSLRHAPYGAGDTLVIHFRDVVSVPEDHLFRMIDRQSGPRDESVDLTGYRLYPQGNEITYSVLGRNETSDEARIIQSTDRLRLAVRIEDAAVSDLNADIDPLDVSVSDDANGDGRVDVLDDNEAGVTAFDGLNLFEDVDLSDVQLAGSELRLRIRTNVAADFALYAVIAGVGEAGEPVYLKGRGSAAVDPADPFTPPFSAGPALVDPADMIRLEVAGASSPDQAAERTVVLDAENSNIDAFVSRVPRQLRVAARMVIQPDGGRVHLRTPFLLETSIGTSIPLAVTGGSSFHTSFGADLSALEGAAADAGDVAVVRSELELDYANSLPLGLDLQVDVLDGAGSVVASFPKDGETLHVEPAATDAAGLAEQPGKGRFTIGASRADLEALSRGERIRLQFALTTDGDGRARLRATDTFTMRLRGRFDVRIRVD